jgi:mycofactocin glycosyltransferase
MSGRRYALDHWVRRSDRGRLLAGGAPARLVRLSDAGSRALDGLLAGERGGASERLLVRLRAAGLVHPLAERPSAAPLTTVIPVRDGGESLAALVAAARQWGETIVVDDRSTDGSAERARAAGARVIANDGPPGPAAARNAGLRAAATELVAFVDADCSVGADPVPPGSAVAISSAIRGKARPHSARLPGSDWAPRLAGLLEDDPGLALVAPRVRSAPGNGAIARYEVACSPLDMGPAASLVGPGRRLAYVPSTAMVARRSLLLELGGFDERLRFGEDVDLVWRLAAAGWRVRYAPEAAVLHRPRPTATALARQRFEYGRSAAALDRLHPGEVAPLRLDPYGAATWAAGAALGWRGAGAATALAIAAVARRGSDAASRRALAGVAARGQLQSGRHLARAIVRDWLPLTALACAISPRARRVAALAAALDLASRPAQAAPLPLLRALDHAAYAAGLWAGALREHSPSAIMPRAVRTRGSEASDER